MLLRRLLIRGDRSRYYKTMRPPSASPSITALRRGAVVMALTWNVLCIAQNPDSASTAVTATPKLKAYRIRKVAWFTPSRVNEINGIALGLGADASYQDSIRIRGINIGLNPVASIACPFIFVAALFSPFSRFSAPAYAEAWMCNKYQFNDSARSDVRIVGLNLSTMLSHDLGIEGVSITLVYTEGQVCRGVSIAGGANYLRVCDGLAIAGLQNKIKRGHGLQIALFNWSDDWQGVQIGLLNRIGNRTLPFVNMRFGRHSRRSTPSTPVQSGSD